VITAWLDVEGKDDQRVRSVLSRSPINETAALYESVEAILVHLLEFRSIVDVQGYESMRVAMIAHAVIPRIHVPTVVVRKIKFRREKIMEGVPVC
jgi:hypothetical protein